MEFHERLQAVIDKKNMTQIELAVKSGIEQPTISRWKNLKPGKLPSKNSLKRIANATGCTLRWLRDGEGPMFWQENEPKSLSAISYREQAHRRP